jgi:quercetin dioxygenase-like cupin family protein
MLDLFRRVVTTRDSRGKPAVLSDMTVTLRAFAGADAKGVVVWTTRAVPADNVRDLEGDRRDPGLLLKRGSAMRVTQFGPGYATPMHRTRSIDYIVVLAGDLEMELDSGAVVPLRAGDAVVQRGGMHRWRNPSANEPCRIMIVMVEAEPVSVDGKKLKATPAWLTLAAGLISTIRPEAAHPAATARASADGMRTIVTAHDEAGKTVVLSDRETPSGAPIATGARSATLWSTPTVPARNSGDAPRSRDENEEEFRGGSAFRIVELEPGSTTPFSRTASIDYVIVLTGEVELVLDGGETTRLRALDTAVQRGERCAWRNPGAEARCRLAICGIEARP